MKNLEDLRSRSQMNILEGEFSCVLKSNKGTSQNKNVSICNYESMLDKYPKITT